MTAAVSISHGHASAILLSRYMFIGTTTAFVWEWILSIPQEVNLVPKGRLTYPTVVYFCSRLLSLVYLILSTILEVAPLQNCQAVADAGVFFFALATPTTALLFFFRVRAVFYSYTLVIAFAAIIWLALLGTAFAATFTTIEAHIMNTNLCVTIGSKPYAPSAFFVSTFNDTFTYLAISWYLLRTTHLHGSWRSRIRVFFRGSGMGDISTVLLKSGQVYYLSTVGMHLFLLALVFIPLGDAGAELRTSFTVPTLALENCVACLVYRQLALGLLESLESQAPESTTLDFAPMDLSPLSHASEETRRAVA